MRVSHVHQWGRGMERAEEGDGRTIPKRMATYLLTAISLANLFSPGSTNEVEAEGLSERATTIPLRKPRDDIPQSGELTVVWRERGRRDGEREGEKEGSRLALSSRED